MNSSDQACLPLAGRREVFANGVAVGLNHAEAARRAGFSAHSAARTAYGLLKEPAVASRVAWLIENRRAALARLEETRALAVAAGDAASAIRAVEMQAAISGLLPDQGAVAWA
jgi:phage terminase small subunit